jgi:hypothetical protein
MARKSALSKLKKTFYFRGMIDVVLQDGSKFLDTYQSKVMVAAVEVECRYENGRRMRPARKDLRKALEKFLDTLFLPSQDETIWDSKELGIDLTATCGKVGLRDDDEPFLHAPMFFAILIARRK